MVRVTIKSASYDRIEFEFEEFDIPAANFVNTALAKAAGKVSVEIETVDPAGEPQEKSRFIEPEEITEVPAEELESVEEFF
jgi:hypothetical protein